MIVRNILLILGLFWLVSPKLAHADEITPIDNSELDKLCNWWADAKMPKNTGDWRLPKRCDYVGAGPFRVPNFGLKERELFDVLRVEFLLAYLEAYDSPNEDLANFWVLRMRDSYRAKEFESLLRRYAVNQSDIDDFHDLRERFTLLERDRDLVLHHSGFSAEEREELIGSAVEQMTGLSESLIALLNKILTNDLSSSSLAIKFKEQLKEYLEMVLEEKKEVRNSGENLSDKMALSIIGDEDERFAEEFKECLQQRKKPGKIWGKLGAEFSLWSINRNTIFRSEAYQSYIEEQKALDVCVLSMFQAALDDERRALLINMTFGFEEHFASSKKRLNGTFFIEAIIKAMDQFSAVRHNEWNAELELEWYESNIEVLTGAWQTLGENVSESPDGGNALLYFVSPTNSEGRFEPRFAGWLIGQWLAQSDIDELTDQGRVVTFEGEYYLLPPSYAFRTINSADRLQRFKAMRIIEVAIN